MADRRGDLVQAVVQLLGSLFQVDTLANGVNVGLTAFSSRGVPSDKRLVKKVEREAAEWLGNPDFGGDKQALIGAQTALIVALGNIEHGAKLLEAVRHRDGLVRLLRASSARASLGADTSALAMFDVLATKAAALIEQLALKADEFTPLAMQDVLRTLDVLKDGQDQIRSRLPEPQPTGAIQIWPQDLRADLTDAIKQIDLEALTGRLPRYLPTGLDITAMTQNVKVRQGLRVRGYFEDTDSAYLLPAERGTNGEGPMTWLEVAS